MCTLYVSALARESTWTACKLASGALRYSGQRRVYTYGLVGSVSPSTPSIATHTLARDAPAT